MDIDCAVFDITSWPNLWGELTLAQIQEIDLVVKNQSEHYSIVRTKARTWKKLPAITTCPIVINPKIDSKKPTPHSVFIAPQNILGRRWSGAIASK